jgi:predicted O-methyltransferase YrrM
MTEEQWTAVDRYITELVARPDAVLDAVLETSIVAGLPEISVTPSYGKLLYLLARIRHASRILEIGTLGAYSTIWLARALPSGGRLVTLESDPSHAAVARSNIARAGLTEAVDLRVGLALDALPTLAAEGQRFDLAFIDADKPNIPEYFEWAIRLSNAAGLIIVDNVVRGGAVIDATSDDPSIRGVRRLNELIAGDKRVSATTIQTVGGKGYDGFTIALVT